jgi:hypothetical protein
MFIRRVSASPRLRLWFDDSRFSAAAAGLRVDLAAVANVEAAEQA